MMPIPESQKLLPTTCIWHVLLFWKMQIQELCPFYCVFYLPKMWWIHLDLGFLKCLLFIVTRLEKPHKYVYKCPTDNTAKVLYCCSIINDQCSSILHTSCSMKTYKTTYSLLPQTKSHQPCLYANMAQKFSIHST